MIDYLKKFLSLLRQFPVWLRAIILVLLASLVFVFSICSCGQLVRVTVKDTPNGVTISTSQQKKDSSSTNINVNPNIHYYAN